MAAAYTVLSFHATAIESAEGEKIPLDQAGIFLCSASHPDPEAYLAVELSKLELRPIEVQFVPNQLAPNTPALDRFQELMNQEEIRGYGLSLIGMRQPKTKPRVNPNSN
jgi:hypothetical protein